jgi:hypothetical protein
MRSLNIAIAVGLVLAAAVPASAQETTGSTTQAGALPRECAMRDRQLVAWLEPYEMDSEIAKKAFATIMRARRACYGARVAEGLALYDSIGSSVTVMRAE